DPAVVDARRELVRRLWIDRALLDDAAKRELQMLGRATEAVVQVDVAAGGIDVVAPEQALDARPGPYALRCAGRASELLRRLLIFGPLLALRLLGRLLLSALLLG